MYECIVISCLVRNNHHNRGGPGESLSFPRILPHFLLIDSPDPKIKTASRFRPGL